MGRTLAKMTRGLEGPIAAPDPTSAAGAIPTLNRLPRGRVRKSGSARSPGEANPTLDRDGGKGTDRGRVLQGRISSLLVRSSAGSHVDFTTQ
jgi:hypothetical protein